MAFFNEEWNGGRVKGLQIQLSFMTWSLKKAEKVTAGEGSKAITDGNHQGWLIQIWLCCGEQSLLPLAFGPCSQAGRVMTFYRKYICIENYSSHLLRRALCFVSCDWCYKDYTSQLCSCTRLGHCSFGHYLMSLWMKFGQAAYYQREIQKSQNLSMTQAPMLKHAAVKEQCHLTNSGILTLAAIM